MAFEIQNQGFDILENKTSKVSNLNVGGGVKEFLTP